MILPVAEDLYGTLIRFHREVMLPDLTEAVSESEKRIRDQMLDLFDGVFQRMDRLELESTR